MDHDTFLTALYVTVDDFCKASLPPEKRHPGPEASLSRSEVVTLAIFSQWSRFASERDFWRFAEARLRGAFPRLPDRSQFNRLARLHQEAIVAFGLSFARAAMDYEAVDTLPVTVRQYKRRGRSWLAGQADIGYSKPIASWYFGLRLLLATSPQGIITGFGFGPASAKDQRLADTLFALRAQAEPRLLSVGETRGGGCYVADKGFEGEDWQLHWRQDYGVTLLHAPRRNSLHPWSPAWRHWLASLRQTVETVFAKLTGAFRLDRERPHDLRGFSARLAAKVALHNFCHWLNRSLQRPSLAFADLLGW